MSSKQIVNIILCGAFSPITFAHLRALEQARDTLQHAGKIVKRGILSPVSDAYKKNDLASAKHRANMISLAIADSDWMELNTWEIEQDEFTPTLKALEEIQKVTDPDIPLLLVGGADLVESMKYPNIWPTEDVRGIASQFGIVVIKRKGFAIDDIIKDTPALEESKDNIYIASENVLESVSSTQLRKAIREQNSISYLTPDSVIKYIKEHNLWNNNNNTE